MQGVAQVLMLVGLPGSGHEAQAALLVQSQSPGFPGKSTLAARPTGTLPLQTCSDSKYHNWSCVRFVHELLGLPF